MKKKKKSYTPHVNVTLYTDIHTTHYHFFPFLSRGDTTASLGDSNEPPDWGKKKKFIYKIFNFFFFLF